MIATIFMVLTCLCLLGSVPAFSQAVVYGKIENQLLFFDNNNNSYQPNQIKLYPDNLLNKNDLLLIVPNEQGYYRVDLPVQQPVPVIMEYNNKTLQLFVSPGDLLSLNFDAADIVQSAKVEGIGAQNNSFLIAFQQRYNPEETDNEARSRRDYADRHSYFAFCEDRYILEREFILNRLNRQTYPEEFANWIMAEITYRKANRISAYYYKSEDPLQDDYLLFAQAYNFNDINALVSNQYLLFLENHLRQLSKRDEFSLKVARQANRVPWVVRGYELVKQHYTGIYRQIMLTRMMMDISDVMYENAAAIYEDYQRQQVSDGLQALASAQYQKYVDINTNALTPPDANLVVLPQNAKTTMQELLTAFTGKVVYIDFWASWCAPCLQEMRNSAWLRQEYQDKNVAFVYISLDETADMWRTKIAELGVNGHHYLLNASLLAEVTKNWNVGEIPRYFLVNKQGVVVNDHAPSPSSNEIVTALNQLLNGW